MTKFYQQTEHVESESNLFILIYHLFDTEKVAFKTQCFKNSSQ